MANAGLTNFGEFLTYTPEAFDRLMAVNLRGSYFTAQFAARIMIDRKIPGRILLMSSVTGGQAFLNLGAYGVTKAGIRHMAKVLALELGKYDITVNAISPGLTLTERTLQDDPECRGELGGGHTDGRAGHVEDIAAAALFLASPEARHISGQTLEVDGGWTTVSAVPSGHPQKPGISRRSFGEQGKTASPDVEQQFAGLKRVIFLARIEPPHFVCQRTRRDGVPQILIVMPAD